MYDGLPSAPSYWELINTTASSSGSGDGGDAVEGVEEGGVLETVRTAVGRAVLLGRERAMSLQRCTELPLLIII